MDKYLVIFDILYKYKDSISDNDYLILNNRIKDLYDIAKIEFCNCKTNMYNCFDNIDKLRNCKKYLEIIENIPLLELIYNEKKISLETEPNFDNKDLTNIMQNLNNINKLYRIIDDLLISNIRKTQYKTIILVAYFDYVMRNMYIVKVDNLFRDAYLFKLQQLEKISDIICFLAGYDFDVNIWKFAALNSIKK